MIRRIGHADMPFEDYRMTISEVVPYVWQGATPRDSTADFGVLGAGSVLDINVFALAACEPAFFRGAVTIKLPIHDNANEPAENPPKIIGTTIERMRQLADSVAARAKDKLHSVALCQWGYNRSGLLVGLAMARLGYSFDDIMRLQKESRGPHPCGFGDPLNNNNFRALVRLEARG